MSYFYPKPLRYQSLYGISQLTLTEHYKIYLGYVERTNEIRSLLLSADRAKANATYSPYRELKLEETYSLNGIKLHELYFENLTPMGEGEPEQELLLYLGRSFGSWEKWREDFTALGMSARGWAIMALDLDEKIRNFLQDAHNLGEITRSLPLLVLDVYEHAYFLDYMTDRKGYIEAFFRNIHWGVVNRRFRQALAACNACYPFFLPLDL
ncbi:MAG TPA: superoxide dismutase [Moorella mulderi]|nr:superoxide dismutase [Moorella mulderi]